MSTSGDPTQRRLPLAGLRIVDFTRLLPGNYATQWLADFGADVVKIEDPRGGDPARWFPPYADGTSLYFLALNRNKRSLAIDLKAPEGRAALHRLIARADVVVESFRPGVMARLGMGPEALRAQFPRLIYCAITGYGQDGPAAQRAGHDLNYQGYAGMLHLNRGAGMVPVLPATQMADLAGGTLPALMGILVALVGRAVSGQGDIVDVSMLDSTLALQPLQVMLTLALGTAPQPGELQLHGGEPVYGIYEAADGAYLTLAALEPKFWERFCTLVAHPEWVPLHLTSDAVQREQLRQELVTLFASRPRAAWLALLAEEDTCVGPVLTLSETLADPQVRARRMIRETNLGTEQFTQGLASTPRLAHAAPAPQRPPPLLGEHSDEVLAEAGLTNEEIAALRKAGIVPNATRRKQ
jgi:crotonobetainyl-CoA:carnitine CoA-transferase CaiB-like acyl-CoA transferase